MGLLGRQRWNAPLRVGREARGELRGLEPARGHVEEHEVAVVTGRRQELRENPARPAVREVPREPAPRRHVMGMSPPHDSSAMVWMNGACTGRPIATEPSSIPWGGAYVSPPPSGVDPLGLVDALRRVSGPRTLDQVAHVDERIDAIHRRLGEAHHRVEDVQLRSLRRAGEAERQAPERRDARGSARSCRAG